MKNIIYLLIILLFIIPKVTTSQEYNTSDLLIFKSPSEHFKDVVIQTYKGLPRFGVLNQYTTIRNPTERKIRTQTISPIKKRLVMSGMHNYKQLIGLKYSETIMKDLNTEKPTTMRSSSQDAKDKNNADSQEILRGIISPTLCKSDLCSKPYTGKNEFERLKNYKAFTSKVLPDLLKWSKTFFKDDGETVYHVERLSFTKTYDFDKKGYWGQMSFNLFTGRQKMKSVFEPKSAYEKSISEKLNKRNSVDFFIPIDETTAEDIQVNQHNLYLVRKIQFSILPEARENLSQILLSYNHLSPIIEIYKDQALTQKVSSLSMENLKFKK